MSKIDEVKKLATIEFSYMDIHHLLLIVMNTLDREPCDYCEALKLKLQQILEKQEPEPDESLLLSDEEIDKVINSLESTVENRLPGTHSKAVAKAQLAKDKARCQARVEKLIEDMEQYKTLDVIIISPEAWQALKKQEGVIIEQGGDVQSS
jgi:hypothetical protein